MATGGAKQDTDLLDFERSLRQLELLADTSTPTKRQSNTRNQEARSNRQGAGVDVAFLPQPDANQALATEQNLGFSDRQYNQNKLGVKGRQAGNGDGSTRKPSFSDLMTDSVLNGGGGIYEQMKRNMERTVERENERFQRRKTLKQIKDRDADDKAKQVTERQRRNKSEAIRTTRDRSPPKDRQKQQQREQRRPRHDDKSQQSRNLFTQSRSPSKQSRHQRQSSPKFRSSPNKESQIDANERNARNKRRSRTANTDASDLPIPGAPSLEQIKEQHRMNALKVVDIYRQLQNSPLLAIQDLKENQMVAAEIELSNMNSHSTARQASQPDESQRDIFLNKSPKPQRVRPQLTSAARNPSNDDIITSTFIHVLSAFAIAEAQQDIFLRIKSYVILSNFELPKLNGIYNGSDFGEVRAAKTRYLHFLFSQALQTAIHANWIAMAHSILIHCKDMLISLQVSKMDLSVLLNNANFELMNLLIEYGAYFDRNSRSIEAERMVLEPRKRGPLDRAAGGTTEGDEQQETVSEQHLWLNQTGFRKNPQTSDLHLKELSKSAALSPFKSKLDQSNDSYSRALTNLDQTRVSMRNQINVQEQSMLQNLKRGLIAGHSQLNASHFIRQLYDDRADLGAAAENHERFQIQIRELLKALSISQSFEQVIPLLVLRGNRDLVYDMLTDKKTSSYSFELSFDSQKCLALEIFCFSVSQEQLDEAINVLLKFYDHLTFTHRKKCLNELMAGLKRSAAFLELKYFLLSQYYNRMTQIEALELLDIIENRLIATYCHQSQHRSALLQNANSLRSSLLTLFIMGKLQKLIPHSEKRVGILFQKVIDQQAEILDRTPHTEFDKIILSCNRKDLFGNDVLYYLAYTKPGQILKCQVVQKLIDQHWSARPSTSSAALLHHSTCSQIVFHSKLRQHVPLKKLFLGNSAEIQASLVEAKEHLLPAVNFKAWKQGLSTRFTIDSLLNIAVITFLQYMVITYLDARTKIDTDDSFVRFLLLFIQVRDFEEINATEQAGYFLAFTYCFVIGGVFLFAVISKGILSGLYLIHTGYKGHQQISLADQLLFLAVALFTLFYFYMHMRVPEYYEEIEGWGEQINDGVLLNFNANLHNMETNQSVVVSIRFWPFLVVAAMWFHFLSRLQLHRGMGAYVIMMRLAATELGKFLVFWLISLTFFSCVTLVWFGNHENYGDFLSVLQSLYLTSLGLTEPPVELQGNRETGFYVLHAVFVLINLIGFISFLTAMMTQTLVESRSRLVSMQNGYFVERLPKERYHDKAGWLAVLPLILAPFFLVFTYPCFLITKKLAKGPGAANFNTFICALLYLPVCLAQLACFSLMNLLLLPMAYVGGLYQLITQNPYRDTQVKRNKALQVAAFFFLGIPFLLFAQLPNAYYCLLFLYAPKRNFNALSVEEERQRPVNTRNIQRMYQVVSQEVLEQVQDSQQHHNLHVQGRQNFNRSKSLLERLRNAFGIINCVKMLFMGSLPGQSKISARFLAQLQREGQTIKTQLDCYNLLKTQVIEHKEVAPSEELRLGLLFQYLQEIKMKIVAQKVLQNYKDGKEMRMIEFININGSSKPDAIAREILQTNPNLVLKVLQAEEQASLALKEAYFVKELHSFQAQIMAMLKRQALQSHMLQGATMEQLRDNHSMLSQSDAVVGASNRATSLMAATSQLFQTPSAAQAKVNQLQLAIAQQEAVYTFVRKRQQEKAPDPQDHSQAYAEEAADKDNGADSADSQKNEQDISDDAMSPPDNASVTVSETPTDFKAGFIRKKTMTERAQLK